MPLRGSVQFLLLFLHRRAARKVAIGVVAAGVLGLGAVQFNGALSSLGEDGLVRALRQSAWQQALSDQSMPVRWPWEDLSTTMSPAPTATVPRLGLSAAMRYESAGLAEKAGNKVSSAPERTARVKTRDAKSQRAQGDVALSDVTIGDSITFTAADGATCVYRITGRRVVDPHLAASEAERFGEPALFDCGPLESLILQATQAEPKRVPDPAQTQRKL